MKKIVLISLACLSLTCHAAEPSDTRINGYQEGIAASNEAVQNQKLWENGEGDPRMAQAYQEGLNAIDANGNT